MIGRGANYGTAFEAALKLSELTGAVAVPCSSADFLHGPIAIVEPGLPDPGDRARRPDPRRRARGARRGAHAAPTSR